MMTNQEVTALEAVIDYLAEEADDYEQFVANGGDPSNHIYTHIETLKDYVRGLHSTGNIKGEQP